MLLSSSTQSEPKLVCWDFDLSITNSHFHNQISNAGIVQGSPDVMVYFRNHLCRIEEIKSPWLLAKVMLELHEQGYKQAVTSFTSFPEVIKPTLEVALKAYIDDLDDSSELHKSLLENLLVIGGFPGSLGVPVLNGGDQNHPDAKMQHIKLAMSHFGLKSYQNVTLIEDSLRNNQVAQQNGVNTIQVSPYINSDEHLYRIRTVLLVVPPKSPERDFLRSATDCLSNDDGVDESQLNEIKGMTFQFPKQSEKFSFSSILFERKSNLSCSQESLSSSVEDLTLDIDKLNILNKSV